MKLSNPRHLSPTTNHVEALASTALKLVFLPIYVIIHQSSFLEHLKTYAIRLTLQKVLSLPENIERHLTTEQICDLIKLHYPSIWQEINNSFPNFQEYPMPITQYTASNFVAKALSYYSRNNGIPGLETQVANGDELNNPKQTNTQITFWRLKKI